LEKLGGRIFGKVPFVIPISEKISGRRLYRGLYLLTGALVKVPPKASSLFRLELNNPRKDIVTLKPKIWVKILWGYTSKEMLEEWNFVSYLKMWNLEEPLRTWYNGY